MAHLSESVGSIGRRYVNMLGLQMKTVIVGALALVAALAWNEAFKRVFASANETYGPWLYAVIITVIAAAIGMLLTDQPPPHGGG